jgi:hypothetical protein
LLDASSSATNVGTTGNAGTITPTASGELIFSAINIQNAVTGIAVTTPGMTVQPTANGATGTGWNFGTVGFRSDGCDNESSGNTPTTCAFSWTGSNTWGAIIAAFKPAMPPLRKGQTIISTLRPFEDHSRGLLLTPDLYEQVRADEKIPQLIPA